MRISDWSSDVCSSDLPEPSACTGRAGAPPCGVPGIGMPKRRAKSSNGPPGPNGDDPNGDAWADGAGWGGKMFTTAGAPRSTSSAYPAVAAPGTPEIGRAACRGRVWQYV